MKKFIFVSVMVVLFTICAQIGVSAVPLDYNIGALKSMEDGDTESGVSVLSEIGKLVSKDVKMSVIVIVLSLHAIAGLSSGIASLVSARMFKCSKYIEYFHVSAFNKLRDKNKTVGLPLFFILVIPSLLLISLFYALAFGAMHIFLLRLSFKPFKVFINKKPREAYRTKETLGNKLKLDGV